MANIVFGLPKLTCIFASQKASWVHIEAYKAIFLLLWFRNVILRNFHQPKKLLCFKKWSLGCLGTIALLEWIAAPMSGSSELMCYIIFQNYYFKKSDQRSLISKLSRPSKQWDSNVLYLYGSQLGIILWYNWASSWENCFCPMLTTNSQISPRSLSSTFVVRSLDSIIPVLAISEISRN